MNYGKIVNGALWYAPYMIRVGNDVYPDPDYPIDLLVAEGYKPVIETKPPVPEKGYHYDLTFTDTGVEIVFTWVLVEDDPSIEDMFEILMGDKK